MSFAKMFREIVTDYLQYLQDGGVPVHLEYKPRRHIEGLVHPSSLFDCPRYEVRSRGNVPVAFPDLTNRNQPTALFRMLQGNKIAEIFQEALVWTDRLDAWAEDYYFNERLGLQGQVDALVAVPGEHDYDVVEFKHRLPGWKEKKPMPRIGDVFQLFAYMHDIGNVDTIERGHLVIADTPFWRDYQDPMKGYEVWSLVPDGRGYKLYSETGEAWNDERNTGEFINDDTLKEEIQRQLNYMSNDEHLSPPIDLADPAQAWRCRDIKYHPKNGNPGVMVPRCPHFCHANSVPTDGLKFTTGADDVVEFIWEF